MIQARWHVVGEVSELGEHVRRRCDERDIFVTSRNDQWRVFDAVCPHLGATLAFARIQNNIVECALHGWRFDVRDGRCVRFGMQDLTEFETRLDGQQLLARW